VLSSVKLDYEPRFETREVGDITTDWRLAAETIAVELALPQMSPKVLLGDRRLIR